MRFFRFACNFLKYSAPRLAISLPPFRPRVTAAGSFFLAKTYGELWIFLPAYYGTRRTACIIGMVVVVQVEIQGAGISYSRVGKCRYAQEKDSQTQVQKAL